MSRQWSGRTRGGYWGNRIFISLLRSGMLLPAYALLILVALFFMLFRGKLCAGTRIYLSNILGRKIGAFSPRLYRLILNFGTALLDRTAYMSGSDKISLDSSDSDRMIGAALARGRGVLVLSAHVGGWESAAERLGAFGAPVSIVGADDEDARISKMRADSETRRKPSIQRNEDSGFLNAYAVLKSGNIAAMLADRYVSGRFAKVDFLGKAARFPTLPYYLAKKTDCALVQIACVRTSLFNYKTICFDLRDGLALSETKVENLLGKYVLNLESVLKKYPYQWYNFFDFWSQ